MNFTPHRGREFTEIKYQKLKIKKEPRISLIKKNFYLQNLCNPCLSYDLSLRIRMDIGGRQVWLYSFIFDFYISILCG